VSDLGDFQILLIDDHASDAKLFQHAMEQAATRARLYWVATAEEGLEFLRRDGRFTGADRPKLVVSDLNMPGMDGFQFLAEMRKNPATAIIPVVIFSSSRSPRDVLRCYQLGANSFIVKPMSLETFVAAIGTLVRYWLDIVEAANPGMID
jgi:two-component system, chemotaxis family, response regulator Rcp1